MCKTFYLNIAFYNKNKRKIEKKDISMLDKSKSLEEHFDIENAYYLGLPKLLISKVIKSGDSTTGV